jgi:hypothetical protein
MRAPSPAHGSDGAWGFIAPFLARVREIASQGRRDVGA